MSIILISLKRSEDESPKVIRLIRNVTGELVSSIKTRLVKKNQDFFYKGELFQNDHVEIDCKIRQLIEGFKKLKIELFILEIACDQIFEEIENYCDYQITSEVLFNILDECCFR